MTDAVPRTTRTVRATFPVLQGSPPVPESRPGRPTIAHGAAAQARLTMPEQGRGRTTDHPKSLDSPSRFMTVPGHALVPSTSANDRPVPMRV